MKKPSFYWRDFWWDFHAGYRSLNYLPFKNISDLVDQFNYVGFHDVCIYPNNNQLAPYKDPMSNETKGIPFVIGGHISNNQTGKE